jgi:hypothetical protein
MSDDQLTEADTCMRYVDPLLFESHWSPEFIRREYKITKGRIIPEGKGGKRNDSLKADYTLLAGNNFKIFESRKSWGLVDKDRDYWTDKIMLEDYDAWEREFIDRDNSIDYRDVSVKQPDYMFYCSDFKLQELIDVRPSEGSTTFAHLLNLLMMK